MDYLVQQNRRVAGLPVTGPELSGQRPPRRDPGRRRHERRLPRQRAARGLRLRRRDRARPHAAERSAARSKTWPEWPFLLRTYPAHEEGGEREWQLATYALEGDDGRVQRLRARRVEFPGFAETGLRKPVPVPGGEVVLDVDLVFVAIGFTGVETGDPLYGQLGVELCARATRCPSTPSFATALDGVFAAGDCVRGADLIVQAIADGREAARSVDLALQGASALPSRVAV